MLAPSPVTVKDGSVNPLSELCTASWSGCPRRSLPCPQPLSPGAPVTLCQPEDILLLSTALIGGPSFMVRICVGQCWGILKSGVPQGTRPAALTAVGGLRAVWQ